MTTPRRTLILGSAGRDFHMFNSIFRADPSRRVLGFTSADVSSGDQRRYPSCLAGTLYPDGIPIIAETDLERFITENQVDDVVFAYAEIGCSQVAGMAARVLAAGADFQLLSPQRSMLPATKPVIAVTSAHIGAGKSPTVRYVADLLRARGLRVAVIQHPPRTPEYDQGWNHAQSDDLADACAAPVVTQAAGQPGVVLVSGADQRTVLSAAAEQADVILWDGAGTDLPFLRADLHLVLVDPLRTTRELEAFPGEVSLRLADAVIISKCDAATPEQIAQATTEVTRLNPHARVLTADSPVVIDGIGRIAGRTVVVVEAEPTLALGALRPGAGIAAAHKAKVSAIISPLPQAVGTVADRYAQHPEAQSVLPVSGWDDAELADVRATLEATPSEAIIDATRLHLAERFGLNRPVATAVYALRPHDPDALAELVLESVTQH